MMAQHANFSGIAYTFTAALLFAGVASAQDQGGSKESDEKKLAPSQFQVKFETSAGDFVIEVNRSWSPNGVDHFYRAVKSGFYDGCRFFRVKPDFVVQFGINGDPKVQAEWRNRRIRDDKVVESNKPGYVTFAKTGQPHSRTTQIFINYTDNSSLDELGFSPFGRVIKGMESVEKINSEYGERPDQGLIQQYGNEYLERQFPRLDYIEKATVLEDDEAGEKKDEKTS